MLKNQLKFWILFVLLNCIIFLPKYLLEVSSSSFLPFTGFGHLSLFDCVKSIFIRYNYDIFRINVDFFVMVVLFYIFRRHITPKFYGWLAGLYYVLMFIFVVYYTTLEKVFLIKPILYDDFYLLKLGFINSGGRLSFLLLIELLVFAGIVWLIVKVFQYFLTLTSEMEFGNKSKLTIGFIGFLFLVNTVKSGLTFEPQHAFQSPFLMMVDNVQYSIDAYRSLNRFDIKKLNRQMNYDQYRLKKRPNVYFFFVESYGKILYENEKARPGYMAMMNKCQQTLTANGFEACSAFSTSPVSGGGSWISYSSVMFGFNLKNEATYLSLLKNAGTSKYNHLFRWFKHQGYRNYRLISMPDNENLKVPWELYSRFYGADEWIRFKDLDYHGDQYGFGPSPPDQYSVFYANQYIQKENPGPYTLFFISQNSHNPFYCPDSVVSDWKTLNRKTRHTKQVSVLFRKPRLSEYVKAIDYDLKSFVQFIVQEGKENDIFVLIGDHQPPLLTSKENGFDTPVHIISRDSLFLSGFKNYGFSTGMLVSGNQNPLRHEGIYSMFMHEFIKNFGADTTQLPVYRPEGIKTTDHEQD